MDAFFTEISPVDCLGIVIGYLCGFRSLSDGVVLIVDESDELAALLVGDLNILADHKKS